MREEINNLLLALKAGSTPFADVIAFIENYYEHQPTAFRNGNTYNESSQNQGSAKVFAFAQLNQLDPVDTLFLFAEHYQSVLNSPDAADHQNIRQFMANGWSGIAFEGTALVAKA